MLLQDGLLKLVFRRVDKSKAEAVILRPQKDGSSFAFMLDKGYKEQNWIAINFIFNKLEPTSECYYLVENQHVKNGKLSLLKKERFAKLAELVIFLQIWR